MAKYAVTATSRTGRKVNAVTGGASDQKAIYSDQELREFKPPPPPTRATWTSRSARWTERPAPGRRPTRPPPHPARTPDRTTRGTP
ncbi:hypothetical protein ID875_21540 [Streptomyces globisporus]|uniref:Uncharacterized protein n=1 Tax=Streptomyces globisporus TaxID=1908 RepID=A0A927BLL3_STRGL|nr:hypothetical protein [Streptomyces globisporus]